MDNCTKPMSFEEALSALKNGSRIFRSAWTDKQRFVAMQKGYPDGIPCNSNTAEAFGFNVGTNVVVNPYLQMWDGGALVTYVPSQADMFAEDWHIV